MIDELYKDDRLTAETLTAALGETAPMTMVLKTVDSTNNEAKRLLAAGRNVPTVIAAERQTAGRGRLGRSFYSPEATGAYFSILYPLTTPVAGAVSVTGACAVAVMRAIRHLTGIQTSVKWVNDLYLNGKKVCGILAEALTMKDHACLIVGIGINLSTVDFPTELSAKAGSLGTHIRRAELIARVWRELKPFLEAPDDRSWLNDYRASSCVIGKPIEWTRGGETIAGVAVGINDDGELEVETDRGARDVLRTGEISVKVI